MIKKARIYGFQMSRISEVYLSTLSAMMASEGLERNFFPLLYLCEVSNELTQTDLAEVIRRDKVYTMRVVDYLSERGFIERKQNAKDRRSQILVPTQKAKKLVPKMKEAILKTDELLFHNFSQEEKEYFEKGMEKIYATLSSLPEPSYIVKAYKVKNK